MPALVTPARLAIGAVLCLTWAAVLALGPDKAQAATPAMCADAASLQQRLDAFDERWNASDAWGLTAQFVIDGSVAAGAEPNRLAVYRELLARLDREQSPRRTQLVRARDVGNACLVDVAVRVRQREEAALFLIAPGQDGGIVAMR